MPLLPHIFVTLTATQKRGAVLGALSMQNTTFRPPLELVEALGLEPAQPSGPYVPREKDLVEYAQGLKNFPVPDQLTVDEAASIFDVWHSAKALHIREYPTCIAYGVVLTLSSQLAGTRRSCRSSRSRVGTRGSS